MYHQTCFDHYSCQTDFIAGYYVLHELVIGFSNLLYVHVQRAEPQYNTNFLIKTAARNASIMRISNYYMKLSQIKASKFVSMDSFQTTRTPSRIILAAPNPWDQEQARLTQLSPAEAGNLQETGMF